MTTFRVGDRVRRINCSNGESVPVGYEGTVTGFIDSMLLVDNAEAGFQWATWNTELIPKVKKVKKVTKRELWGETYTGIYFVAASCDEEYANLLAAAAKHMRENTTSFVSALNFQRDDQDNLTLELVVSS